MSDGVVSEQAGEPRDGEIEPDVDEGTAVTPASSGTGQSRFAVRHAAQVLLGRLT